MTDYCTTCRAYHVGPHHLPEFRAGIPDYEDCDPRDYRVTHARDAQEAARRYAEQFDADGDYTIVRGSDAIVVVLDDMGNMSRWRVSGETVAVYRADEIIQDAKGRWTRWRVSGETGAAYHADEVAEEEATPP